MTSAGTVAQRPEPRYVSVEGTGAYAGWKATAKADFPARVLFLLQGDPADVFAALDMIIVDHNLPDSDGQLAGSMLDVDPREGALHVAGLVFEALATLPNR